MLTKVVPCDGAGIDEGAAIVRAGGLVVFPTETVYGLGGDAENEAAVRAIFAAKGRPADNPLIVHICADEQIGPFAGSIPGEARALMGAFWPGPLTLVLPLREGALPQVTTAGLPTFAVRRPSHPGAARLIQASGRVIAAPSANRSGRPSPTTAQHALEDMQGRVPLILDDGPCQVGLESTVVSALPGKVELLRPGGVTLEMLEQALGQRVAVAQGVDEPLDEGARASSPGMKHRHYAPRAPMIVVDGPARMAQLYDRETAGGGKPLLLCPPGAMEGREGISLGEHPERNLFAALRRADALGATLILFLSMPPDGVGRAVMNRALRAAGFHREQ